MNSFKQWMEDMEAEVGEPKGSKPEATQRMATKLVNKAAANNPSFSTSVMSAPNPRAKAKAIGDFTSNIMKRNKGGVNTSRLTPDVIGRTAADTVGVDYKGMFMKKGMKK